MSLAYRKKLFPDFLEPDKLLVGDLGSIVQHDVLRFPKGLI